MIDWSARICQEMGILGYHVSAMTNRRRTLLNNISATVTLNNGVKMHWLGLGTFKSPAGVVEAAIRCAVDAGYRHIDTAAAYGNEEAIGAVMASRHRITSWRCRY